MIPTEACDQVLDHLGDRLPPALATHAEHCEHCLATLAAYEDVDAGGTAPLPDRALPRIREAAMQELAARPVARPWWQEAIAFGAFNALVTVGAVCALGTQGLVHNRAPTAVVVLLGVLLAATMALATLLSLSPQRRPVLGAMLVACVLAGLAVLAGGSGFDPGMSFWKAGLKCLSCELGISAVPMMAGLFFLTRSARQLLRAALLGAASGLVGMLALHLHCPNGTFLHLLVFHVAPWLLLVGVAAVARTLLPTRSYAP
jgi:hypothetical protein